MTHFSTLELEEQVFDLDRESDSVYGGEFNQRVSITCIDNQPSTEYKIISHIDSGVKYDFNPKFKIILKATDTKSTANRESNTVTVNTCYSASGKYKVYTLYAVYKKLPNKLVPVAIGIIIEYQNKITEKSNETKFYYKYRDFSKNKKIINLYDLTTICNDKIDKKHLDEEYEALNTKLTFNIQTLRAVYINCLTNDKKEELKTNESKFELWNYPSYVKYIYRFKFGFNELEIEGYDAYDLEFKDYKSSHYNNINLDSLSVYYLKYDSKKKVPLIVQFRPKAGYKYFLNNNNCISMYYALSDIKGQKYERSSYFEGQKISEEIYTKYVKYYEKKEIPISNSTGEKLDSICERKHVKKNMEIILGIPQTPEDRTNGAGIAFGIIFFIFMPIGALTYFHYHRLRDNLFDFYYKHRRMHLRGFD